MTRRTLIATLLAAILAPFRRAKAAPKMLMNLDSEAPKGQLVENFYFLGSEAGPRPRRSFDIHPETWAELSPADQSLFDMFDVDDWRKTAIREIIDRPGAEIAALASKRAYGKGIYETHESAPTAAIFGLCPKCGGLQCRCD